MIYFIKSARGRIKIGTTIRLKQRLKELETGHGEPLEVLAVADGSTEAERYLHRRFAHLRVMGEWFESGEDLMALIASDCRPWDGLDDRRTDLVGPWPTEENHFPCFPRRRPKPKGPFPSITTDHPASKYGIPVILDGMGSPMGYALGVKAVRLALGLSTRQLGEAIGKSGRTVEDWEQGRRIPPAEALYVLAGMLARDRSEAPTPTKADEFFLHHR
jgi:DNA-binding XRE family transcriptional regulator